MHPIRQDLTIRFEDLLAKLPGDDMRVAEVNPPALDVSDCFLRRCYAAQLGVNPLHYLKIRRLQLVRCALRHATADSLMPELAPRTRSGKRSVGPKQYLLLRRMTLAHRAVQAANPVETTVSEVAIRFGFWPSTGLPANTGHVRRSAIGHAWRRQAAQQNRPNPVSSGETTCA
ncbi:MAG TPA: hypothetical protein VHT74_23325 [Acetobacteraceae bacterium]|nr:hypothetical protein [Acetobacteraceae bacterium]